MIIHKPRQSQNQVTELPTFKNQNAKWPISKAPHDNTCVALWRFFTHGKDLSIYLFFNIQKEIMKSNA